VFCFVRAQNPPPTKNAENFSQFNNMYTHLLSKIGRTYVTLFYKKAFIFASENLPHSYWADNIKFFSILNQEKSAPKATFI
jgi:hypothetical protein